MYGPLSRTHYGRNSKDFHSTDRDVRREGKSHTHKCVFFRTSNSSSFSASRANLTNTTDPPVRQSSLKLSRAFYPSPSGNSSCSCFVFFSSLLVSHAKMDFSLFTQNVSIPSYYPYRLISSRFWKNFFRSLFYLAIHSNFPLRHLYRTDIFPLSSVKTLGRNSVIYN